MDKIIVNIYDDMFAREATVSRASAMHREKICPADVRPKARRVYWKQRPFQVKAVLWRSRSSMTICQ